MKVAVSALGTDLDSPVDLRFGRTQYYVIVDTETMAYESISNPHMGASGGAGIQAAQMISNYGVQAVISGVLGPNAYQTLQAIGIPSYQATGGSVRETIEAFKAGLLTQVNQPGPSHFGMAGGVAGQGMGRGRGMGRGQAYYPQPPMPPQPPPTAPPAPAKEDDLEELKKQAGQLNEQFNNIMERISKLEKKAKKDEKKS